MGSSVKGAILLAIVGAAGAVVKMLVQAKAAREAASQKLASDAELARIKRDIDERAGRQAKDAAERAAEREQKESLISGLHDSAKETLEVLKTQIAAQEASNARCFEMLDRNTQSIAKLADSIANLAQDSRVMTIKVAELASGAGCRSAERRAA